MSSLKQNIAIEDRPREKALAHGFRTLTPAELIATLIGSGSRGENVVQLCQRILNDHDNKLYKIARRTVPELVKMYRGIGEVKAIQILAAIEFARKYQGEAFEDDVKISESTIAYEIMRPLLADLRHEELWIVTLNRASRVTDKLMISSGGTANTVADVKIILRAALERLAEGIILYHNHPSSQLTPSIDDDHLTSRVKAGCQAVGIRLVDHIIVARSGYYSYLDHGKL